jgi:hypothetical protein
MIGGELQPGESTTTDGIDERQPSKSVTAERWRLTPLLACYHCYGILMWAAPCAWVCFVGLFIRSVILVHFCARNRGLGIEKVKSLVKTGNRAKKTETEIVGFRFLATPIGPCLWENRTFTPPNNRTEMSV